MNIKHILALLAVVAMPLEGVEVMAATIAALRSSETEREATTLSLDGELDIRDLIFLSDSLPKLEELDLSGARIVGYRGDRYTPPTADDVLPPYSLAGLGARRVILPEGLKEIAEGAFLLSEVEELTIPSTVSVIEPMAFAGCGRLKDIGLPDGLKMIYALTFKDCSSLTAIDLPAGVMAIDSCAFAGCEKLAEVRFPKRLYRIGPHAFEGTALRDVDLSDCATLTKIGAFAFAHIPTLTSASLPGSATGLGEGIFFDCISLTEVSLPERIDELPDYILKGTSLTDATEAVREGIVRIGDYALYGNSRLEQLTLPEGIEAIGDRALASLTSLDTLDVSGLTALPTLGDSVFAATASKDVVLLADEDMLPLFEVAPQWREFNVMTYSSADEVREDGELSRLLMRYDGTTIYITAPEPVMRADIYDTEGRELAAYVPEPASAEIALDAAGLGRQIVIIRLTHARDHFSIAKLSL